MLKVEAGNQLWQNRITQAIDSKLSAKGLTKVPDGGDVAVTAFVATQNQPKLETFYDGLGGGWFWRGWGGGGMTTTYVENDRVGTLTVDLFDGHSKKLIWRGASTESLSGDP